MKKLLPILLCLWSLSAISQPTNYVSITNFPVATGLSDSDMALGMTNGTHTCLIPLPLIVSLGTNAAAIQAQVLALVAAENATNTARLQTQLAGSFDALNAALDATNTARLAVQLGSTFLGLHATADAAATATTATTAGMATNAPTGVRVADTNIVTASAAGLAPVLPNDATKYLDGTGNWGIPAGNGGIDASTATNISAYQAKISTNAGNLAFITASQTYSGNNYFSGSNYFTGTEYMAGAVRMADGSLIATNATARTNASGGYAFTTYGPLLINGTDAANTNLVSSTAAGLAPKFPNDATKYLDGTGAYSIPAGNGGIDASTATNISAYQAKIATNGLIQTTDARALTNNFETITAAQALTNNFDTIADVNAKTNTVGTSIQNATNGLVSANLWLALHGTADAATTANALATSATLTLAQVSNSIPAIITNSVTQTAVGATIGAANGNSLTNLAWASATNGVLAGQCDFSRHDTTTNASSAFSLSVNIANVPTTTQDTLIMHVKNTGSTFAVTTDNTTWLNSDHSATHYVTNGHTLNIMVTVQPSTYTNAFYVDCGP